MLYSCTCLCTSFGGRIRTRSFHSKKTCTYHRLNGHMRRGLPSYILYCSDIQRWLTRSNAVICKKGILHVRMDISVLSMFSIRDLQICNNLNFFPSINFTPSLFFHWIDEYTQIPKVTVNKTCIILMYKSSYHTVDKILYYNIETLHVIQWIAIY